MSDPVTNVEIEDVLSSIRRLVSEGERPQSADAAAENSKKNTPERLVLTSAHRIEGADDATPDEDATSDLDDGHADTIDAESSDDVADETVVSGDEDRASLEATIAELEAAVTEQAEEWEPDGSETNTSPSWDNAVFSTVNTISQEEADSPAEQMESQPDVGFSDLYIPKNNELADVGDVDADAPQPENVVEVDEETHPEILQGEDSAVELKMPQTEPQEPALDEMPDGLEEALGNIPDLEQGVVGDAVDATFRHLRNAETEIDPAAALLGASEVKADKTEIPATQDETLQAYLDEGSSINEDALRKLVLEIVRQELQGKLGERITRNVRKLVRREIMRVMNSQDVD